LLHQCFWRVFSEDGTASLGSTKQFSALKISGRSFLAPFLWGAGISWSRDHRHAYICCSNGSEGFSAKDGTVRFFGDKVVQCFEDLRHKLFGTISLGSRDFLCLGVTSELIFVAEMVLKGFQRTDGTACSPFGCFLLWMG
jgi:hypothetical protein